MTEVEELLSDLKAVYGELNPRRNPEAMPYTATELALGVMIRREIRAAVPAAPGTNLRTRTLDRLAKHNPKDCE